VDFSNSAHRKVFFDVHNDLPREGPGDRLSTEKAMSLVKPLPVSPAVLDIACGPGMQTLHLAEQLPQAKLTCFDLHEPTVIEARNRVTAAGLSDRVQVDVCDMKNIPYPDSSFDLIWCEGAAYNMGVEQALTQWKRLLRSGGKIALTEAVWLKPDPPEELRTFWSAYPDMNDIENRREIFKRCGYSMLHDFVLPENAWWDDYYTPMKARLDSLCEKYKGDLIAKPVLDYSYLEIDLYRRYSDYYGYVFLIATI
jgi:ubiquinone/menaquinone biosynthesis C-methylase UbiE